MIQRIILIILALAISGCTEFTLKRSANNKLIDFKGFEGHKRRPLYNKKYITRAKRNIIENDVDEDESDGSDEMDEISDPAAANRSMYRDMTIKDIKHKRQQMQDNGRGYPKLGDAKSIVDEGDPKSSQDLQREIAELKKMMLETKKDLVKYRCPMEHGKADSKPKARSQGSAHTMSDSIGLE